MTEFLGLRRLGKRDLQQRGQPYPRPKAVNGPFAASDEHFRAACERAGVQPTARQASKYRSGRGRAYQHRQQAAR